MHATRYLKNANTSGTVLVENIQSDKLFPIRKVYFLNDEAFVYLFIISIRTGIVKILKYSL